MGLSFEVRFFQHAGSGLILHVCMFKIIAISGFWCFFDVSSLFILAPLPGVSLLVCCLFLIFPWDFVPFPQPFPFGACIWVLKMCPKSL